MAFSLPRSRRAIHLAQGFRVSVIVPSYNYESHLPERLRSIVTQSYRPYEIVFLDDCSSDGSVGVAEALLKDAGIPHRVIRNSANQGVYRQWLRGLREATGDLVWIAEAADDCAPTRRSKPSPCPPDERLHDYWPHTRVSTTPQTRSGSSPRSSKAIECWTERAG
jgi:hypothetical protein